MKANLLAAMLPQQAVNNAESQLLDSHSRQLINQNAWLSSRAKIQIKQTPKQPRTVSFSKKAKVLSDFQHFEHINNLFAMNIAGKTNDYSLMADIREVIKFIAAIDNNAFTDSCHSPKKTKSNIQKNKIWEKSSHEIIYSSTKRPTYEQWQQFSKEDRVKPGSYSNEAVVKALFKSFGDAGQALLGAVGAVATTQTLIPIITDKLGMPAGVINSPQLLAIGIGPLLANAASNFCKSVVAAITDGRLSIPAAQVKTFENFKARSETLLETAPDFITNPIARIDRHLEQLAAPVKKGNENNFDSSYFNRLLDLRLNVFCMDQEPQEVPGWRDAESRKLLLHKMDEALKYYSPEVASDLKSIFVGMAERSILSREELKEISAKRIQVRFAGPGGTGKSHAVHLVKELLGLPVIEITIPTDREGGFNSLFGKPTNAIDINYYFPTGVDNFGVLGLAMNKNPSNCAIFFDEIDLNNKSNIDAVKIFTDRDKIEVPVKSIDSTRPWNNSIFIASNHEGPVMDAHAIEPRIFSIEMKKSTDQFIIDSGKESLKNGLKLHERSLSPKQLAMAKDCCNEMAEPLFSWKRKSFQGARDAYEEHMVTNIALNIAGGMDKEKTIKMATTGLENYYGRFVPAEKKTNEADNTGPDESLAAPKL